MQNDERQEKAIHIGGCSFLIRILYRQNSTWQGTVQWLDKKQTQSFRSDLELLMLIHEAIESNIDQPSVKQCWAKKEGVS